MRNVRYMNIKIVIFFLPAVITCLSACNKEEEIIRNDGAVTLETGLTGSLQNPAFSPNGKTIVFTRFRKGYNRPPSDLYTFNLETSELKLLVSDGSSNVNLPGECWNHITDAIVFSSDREPHDEIFYISGNGSSGDEIRITNRSDSVAYEPVFSPDGQWIVFESHKLDEEGHGVIMKCKLDGSYPYISLTPFEEDCRQPNWSPAGDKILYQKEENGQWDIWVMNTDGSGKTKVTDFPGNKTDAVFDHNGQYIVFSFENNETEFANIYKVSVSGGDPVRLTNYPGYDGAPSISPDGKKLVFEACAGDPDRSNGTSICVLDL